MNNTTTKTPRFNYTQNAWEGSKYNGSMTLKDICKAVRSELKKMYPDCKFSVSKETYSGGGSITLSLMSAPSNPFNPLTDEIKEKIERNTQRAFGKFWEKQLEQAIENYKKTTTQDWHHGLNQFYISDDICLTEKTKEIMTRALGVLQSYNYDDSDSSIDYFHTNFYVHASIGKWDKPFLQTK